MAAVHAALRATLYEGRALGVPSGHEPAPQLQLPYARALRGACAESHKHRRGPAVRWQDPGLLALALVAWGAVGVGRGVEIAETGVFRARDAIWAVLFFSFAAVLVGAQASEGRRARCFTLSQSVIALAILIPGMPGFEGAMPAIAAAQFGLVAKRRLAAAGIVAQAIPLFAAVAIRNELLAAIRATGEYLAFAAFAMMLFELRQREREQRRDLGRVNAELLRARTELAESVCISEKHRILRELHDGMGHTLAVLSMELHRARQQPSSNALERAQEALDSLREEARAIISEGFSPMSLKDRLTKMADRLSTMRIQIRGQALDELDTNAAWMVFRCAQEAITNAWKHGGAKEVIIRSEERETEIVVRIENDGILPAVPLLPGRGLRGMSDRAAASGAKVDFELGERFAVVVSVPRETEPAA